MGGVVVTVSNRLVNAALVAVALAVLTDTAAAGPAWLVFQGTARDSAADRLTFSEGLPAVLALCGMALSLVVGVVLHETRRPVRPATGRPGGRSRPTSPGAGPAAEARRLVVFKPGRAAIPVGRAALTTTRVETFGCFDADAPARAVDGFTSPVLCRPGGSDTGPVTLASYAVAGPAIHKGQATR